jgi:hypothetical protein
MIEAHIHLRLLPTSLLDIYKVFEPLAWCLCWNFRFLVPISGTPIVSGILILFLIPDIPVEFFLNSAVEGHQIGIPIPKFGFLNLVLCRNSIHFILHENWSIPENIKNIKTYDI